MRHSFLYRAGLLLVLLSALLSAPAAMAQASYLPTGVQQNVPVATVTSGGWAECYRDTYANDSTSIASILASCTGERLMMACRATGSTTLNVLAQAPRADVIFDTGTGNTTRSSNGVEWYFNANYSWGFAPGGEAVSRNSCDTGGFGNSNRICIHTGTGGGGPASNIATGYRCGDQVSFDGAYERILYVEGESATAPDAPTIGTATAGDTQATVTFSAPANDGGSAITGYRVVSAPGGIQATGPASPITVTGLTNGTSYTFTVVAINAVGTSAPSAASNAVVPKGTPALSDFADIAKTWGDADFTLTAPTSTSNGAFSYTSSNPAVATISGNTVTITGAGTAQITANQAEGSAHVAGSISATLTVAKAVPTITWVAPFSRTFGEPDFTLAAPVTNSPGILRTSSSNLSVAELSGLQVSIVGAGTTTLTVTVDEDTNFLAGGTTVEFTVNPAAPTLTWIAPLTRTFGDAAFALDPPTSNSPGAITYSSNNPAVATVSGNTVTITGAGTATLTASQAADANYQAGSVTVSLTVAQAQPTITWLAPISRTFGDPAFALDPPASNSTGAFTYSSDNPAVATVSGNVVTITGAGSATLTAQQAADANYEASSASFTLTVAKAVPTLSWIAPVSKTFGDPAFALDPPTSNSTGAFTYSSDNPAVATVSGNTVTITGAGTATLTVSQAADANYEAASATTTLSVSQAMPVITWTSAISKIWGDPAFALPAPSSPSTGAFSYSSGNTAVATISGNTVTITGAGTAVITVNQAADTNYLAASATLTLTVGKAAPALTWIGDITKTYGEPAFDLPNPTSPSPGAYTFASSNTAVATVSGRTVTITGDGVTTLTVTQAETANYQSATASVQLLVNARPDPRDDPGVVAGLQAQVDASVRFASAQQMNIRDRLRQVRSGSNGNSNALALNLNPGFGPGLGLSAGEAGDASALALPEGWGWWTAGAITFGDRNPGASSSDFGFHTDGISLGVDRKVGDNAVLGLAFGLGWNDTDFDGNSSSLSGEQRALSVYGLWRGSKWFVDGLLGYGEIDFDIRRYSAVADANATATRGGDQVFGSATVGYEHAADGNRLVGYARVDASRSKLDAYRETGLGIYDLSYTSQTVDNSTVSLGVEGGSQWLTSSGVMRPYWMLEYRLAMDNRSDVGINYVVLPSAADYVLGMRSYADDAFVWGGGVDMDITTRWGLSFLYRGERLRDGGDSYGVGLMLSYRGEGPAAAVQPGEVAGQGAATVTTKR